jgi:hypothetical protein
MAIRIGPDWVPLSPQPLDLARLDWHPRANRLLPCKFEETPVKSASIGPFNVARLLVRVLSPEQALLAISVAFNRNRLDLLPQDGSSSTASIDETIREATATSAIYSPSRACGELAQGVTHLASTRIHVPRRCPFSLAGLTRRPRSHSSDTALTLRLCTARAQTLALYMGPHQMARFWHWNTHWVPVNCGLNDETHLKLDPFAPEYAFYRQVQVASRSCRTQPRVQDVAD